MCQLLLKSYPMHQLLVHKLLLDLQLVLLHSSQPRLPLSLQLRLLLNLQLRMLLNLQFRMLLSLLLTVLLVGSMSMQHHCCSVLHQEQGQCLGTLPRESSAIMAQDQVAQVLPKPVAHALQ